MFSMHISCSALFLTITTVFVVFGDPNCKGCLEIDELSFDKISHAFKYTLLKFDIPYPYGSKHDQFASVAQRVTAHHNFDMVATLVGLKDFGDESVAKMTFAKRFNVTSTKAKHLPVVILYNRDEDIFDTFRDSSFKVDNLIKFIETSAGMLIPLEGCDTKLDEIAQEYIQAKDEDIRVDLLRKAESVRNGPRKSKSKNQDLYVKIMKKLLSEKDEKGWVKKEMKKSLKYLEDPFLKYEKRLHFTEKSNILKSFLVAGGELENIKKKIIDDKYEL